MEVLRFYKKIRSFRDRDHSKLYITPFREWGIILSIGTLVLVAVFAFGYNAFNNIYIKSFKEGAVDQVETDPYNIDDFKIESSKVLQYYKEKEDEHKALLEEQPLFKNEASVTRKTSVIGSPDDDGDLEGDTMGIIEGDTLDITEDSADILPVAETETPEDGPGLEVLKRIRSNVSNTASVWKAFFVDPFK